MLVLALLLLLLLLVAKPAGIRCLQHRPAIWSVGRPIRPERIFRPAGTLHLRPAFTPDLRPAVSIDPPLAFMAELHLAISSDLRQAVALALRPLVIGNNFQNRPVAAAGDLRPVARTVLDLRTGVTPLDL